MSKNKKHQPPPPPESAPTAAPSWTGLGVRVLLGAVFLFSGLSKAGAAPEDFKAVLETYDILPDDMLLTMATLLPWLEVLLGFSLISGFWTAAASRAAGGFLGVFVIAILSTKARGIDLANCGCFGAGIHLDPGQAVALDILLIALAFHASRKGSSMTSLDNWVKSGLY